MRNNIASAERHTAFLQVSEHFRGCEDSSVHDLTGRRREALVTLVAVCLQTSKSVWCLLRVEVGHVGTVEVPNVYHSVL